MRRVVLAVLLAVSLGASACGKVGPPVRSKPPRKPPPTATIVPPRATGPPSASGPTSAPAPETAEPEQEEGDGG